MTRRPSGPMSARPDSKTVARTPRTVTGFALFMLFPAAIVFAVSFPVAALATVAGAVLTKLHRRWRTARRTAATDAPGIARGVTHA